MSFLFECQPFCSILCDNIEVSIRNTTLNYNSWYSNCNLLPVYDATAVAVRLWCLKKITDPFKLNVSMNSSHSTTVQCYVGRIHPPEPEGRLYPDLKKYCNSSQLQLLKSIFLSIWCNSFRHFFLDDLYRPWPKVEIFSTVAIKPKYYCTLQI